MKLLIKLTSVFLVFLPLTSGGNQHLETKSSLDSCIGYPYDLGITFKNIRNGSFRLLSTSIVNTKIKNISFITRALKEANLRAKLNMSKFIKLTNSSTNQNIKEISFPIRINGKIIKTNRQLKNKLKKISFRSSNLKGVRQIARCKRSSDYVIVTLEITNETIRAAKFIRKNQ